jgi:coenzyme F420-0:L-glutamate ligase/coenzyme F420-1:gamma-L-glutamate ligase
MSKTPRPISLIPLVGLPEIQAGDQLAPMLASAARAAGSPLQRGDVLVLAQKIVSKAEGRRIPLDAVVPSARAFALAEQCHKDPRLVELVLQESAEVLRCQRDILIVRHRLGFIVANAAIDQSNIEAGDSHALLLPADPDGSAARLREAVYMVASVSVGVIINDSFGRPWRRGTCGVAIGAAGIESLVDLRGRLDRHGRVLRTSEVATADEIAAAASLAMGQADEGVPAVIVRGLIPAQRSTPAKELVRPPQEDLFN